MGIHLSRQLRESRHMHAVAYGKLALIALDTMKTAQKNNDINTYAAAANDLAHALSGYASEGPYGKDLGEYTGVLLALRDRASEPDDTDMWDVLTGFAYPSKARARRDANVSQATLYKHLTALEDGGYLTAERTLADGKWRDGWTLHDKHTDSYATLARNVADVEARTGNLTYRDADDWAILAAVEAHLEHTSDRTAAQRKVVSALRNANPLDVLAAQVASLPQDAADDLMWAYWVAAWGVTERATTRPAAPLPGWDRADHVTAAACCTTATDVLARRAARGLPTVPAGVNPDDLRLTARPVPTPAVDVEPEPTEVAQVLILEPRTTAHDMDDFSDLNVRRTRAPYTLAPAVGQ